MSSRGFGFVTTARCRAPSLSTLAPEMIRAVGSDLDGTLLPASKQISARLKPILEQLKARGILFFPVTGKALGLTLQTLTPLEDLDIPMVCLDGAVLRLKGENFWDPECFLPSDLVKELLAASAGLSVYLFDDDLLYVRGNVGSGVYREWALHCGGEPEAAPLGAVTHLIITHESWAALSELAGRIEPLLGRQVHSLLAKERFYGSYNLVVCKKVLSKCRGAERLLKHYGFELKDMLFFGDWRNDIPLLKRAAFPVAMRNAGEAVARHARAVTLFSNEEAGVERFLIRFFDL